MMDAHRPDIRGHRLVIMLAGGALLMHAASAAAFNFGDMMNPNRWFGGDRYDYVPPPPPPPSYGYTAPYAYAPPAGAAPSVAAPAPDAAPDQTQAAEERIRQLERRIEQLESMTSGAYQSSPPPHAALPAPSTRPVPGAPPAAGPASAPRELPAEMVFRPLDAESIP